jgi:hypothetical protein
LQPLDVSINKPFKSILRRHWQQYMSNKTEELEAARETNNDPRQFSKIPPLSHQMLVDWIADAWRDISRKGPAVSVTKSFSSLDDWQCFRDMGGDTNPQ